MMIFLSLGRRGIAPVHAGTIPDRLPSMLNRPHSGEPEGLFVFAGRETNGLSCDALTV
jgi:hypothetical protein